MHPDLTRSSAIASRLVWRQQSPSTNAELAALVRDDPASWPHFSVLVTDTQTAGRGRRERAWTSAPGRSLAISVLIRADLPVESLGWMPLAAGLAMTRSVRAALAAAGSDPARARVKWPNDVLIGARKVCGVLAELISVGGDSDTVLVLGAGVNTTMTAEERPVETSTSLAVEGVETVNEDEVIATYLRELRALYDGLALANGDAKRSGLWGAAVEACATIGSSVRVELPGDRVLLGEATGLDDRGHLIVTERGGEEHVVTAGDVVHVRPAVLGS